MEGMKEEMITIGQGTGPRKKLEWGWKRDIHPTSES
jgi:hypothetical protein